MQQRVLLLMQRRAVVFYHSLPKRILLLFRKGSMPFFSVSNFQCIKHTLVLNVV